tara:strand:+ start:9796 stop:9951 length:156 start_codon:yes stop_codon:yes gene_type:complete
MKIINEWKSPLKQNDKLEISMRIGKLTILNIIGDYSQKYFKITILNFTVKN